MNFQYDGTERRIYRKEVVSGVTSEALYLHDGMNAIHERTKTGTVTEYVYGPTGIIAYGSASTWKYVIKDHLGSTRAVVDGTTVTGYDYSVFGSILAPVTPNTNYMYTGQEYDKTSGLHNYKARMYDSDLMRFYGMDAAGQGASPFAYTGNNPVMRVDKDGNLFFIPILIGAAIGGGLGAYRAHKMDKSIWEGVWKGALVGAVGGAMASVGGGTFVANVAWGAAEGAFTGGLDAALWGQNVGQGMKWGAISGAAFATVTSGVEAYRNLKEGWGFRTDMDALNHFRREGEIQTVKDILEKRWGLDQNWTVLQDAPGTQGEKIWKTWEKNEGSEMFAATPVNESTQELSKTSYVKMSVFKDTKYSITGTVYHEQLHRRLGYKTFSEDVWHGRIHGRVLENAGKLRLTGFSVDYNLGRYNELIGKPYTWSFWNAWGRRF